MEAKDFVLALLGAGLTQNLISERTGIAQPTISKVARGDVEDVMSRNYRKLKALYDETPAAAEAHAKSLSETQLALAGSPAAQQHEA